MKFIYPQYSIETKHRASSVYKTIADCARTCRKFTYHKSQLKSETSNNQTTSDQNFVKNLIRLGHLSAIEHVSWTVRLTIDRATSHELVRHRLASYSQISQRYINKKENDITFIIPHWCLHVKPSSSDLENTAGSVTSAEFIWMQQLARAEAAYNRLILNEEFFVEDARGVLPNATATEIVVTANAREWLHIFYLRCSPKAHPDMRNIMNQVKAYFSTNYPIIFGESNGTAQ